MAARHSGLLRPSQQSQSSFSNKPKNRVALMFQQNATGVEALQPARLSISSSIHVFLSFFTSAVRVFPLPVSSGFSGRAPVSPHLVSFVRSFPLRANLWKPVEGQEDDPTLGEPMTLALRYLTDAQTPSLCRTSEHYYSVGLSCCFQNHGYFWICLCFMTCSGSITH